MNEKPKYTLRELILYFLKLGTIGFGGPVALVGYMYKDLVENKKWISDEEYKEGLALAQLAPGPLAAQLGIYVGYVHYNILGATLAGFAFITPSFLMVLLLGIIYQAYGGLVWIQSIFYGVSAAVIGIITLSSYKLTIKSIGKLNLSSFKEKWILWLFFTSAIVITYITEKEHILLFVAAGLVYMLIKARPYFKIAKTTNVLILISSGFWNYESSTLMKIAVFFTKAGAFVFGSGLAIVPFLHSGVVVENKWLTEQQFLDSVAIAMITPGPVVITVGFIGYLVNGLLGAITAALATFLPCYLFTIALAPFFKKIVNNKPVKAFVEGITAAVVGALVGSVIIIAKRSIVDISTILIALASILSLIYIKKIQEPYIILIAAVLGVLIKLSF
ncbi:MAG: chromate transporter [Flavobacterium nitrogenifigens]|uniref:chromate transporter n=1 Tax=Flavobacterium nitrogenifigens TaxID=1617283 RepID=UPI002806BD19|nr:chromate transporter [Flavobacterium nitrogenifigens]MDQ8014058.1 chromate transporter [Flavobacterium nitrogenifigens]